MHVLDIPVSPDLAERWLAPARQPFYLTDAGPEWLGLETVTFTSEDRDPFMDLKVGAVADRVMWPR